MKKICLLFLFIAASVLVKAQTTAPALAKDEIQVAAVVEKMRVAMISGNKAELESLLTDDLTYSHSNGKMQTKSMFVTSTSTKESDFKTIKLTDQSITVQGGIAVVRHILTADTNDGGVPAHITLGIVLVLRKQAGNWKVMARRAFKTPA